MSAATTSSVRSIRIWNIDSNQPHSFKTFSGVAADGPLRRVGPNQIAARARQRYDIHRSGQRCVRTLLAGAETTDLVRNLAFDLRRIAKVFHIHRAERADGLVDALGDVISAPLADALQAEVVAVPTRGVERWLTQRLSVVLGASPGRGDGVCANVEFPFPGRLVNGAVATAGGVDREADPWLPERSVWPPLDVVEASLGEPWLAPLSAHLGGANADRGDWRRARRLSERAAHRRSLRWLRLSPARAPPTRSDPTPPNRAHPDAPPDPRPSAPALRAAC